MNCTDVLIDPVTHVVYVEFPAGCTGPETITFRAFVVPCEGSMSDQDQAVFELALTDVPGQTGMSFSLGSPIPNPCISSTQIQFSLPAGSEGDAVSLAVYDLAGRKVRTLLGSDAASGPGWVNWHGRDDRGQPVSTGVYFFRLRLNQQTLGKRVVLIR